MKLPELKIGKLIAKIPIIQGGMAIRVSTHKLSAAVAAAGGIGIIGASGMPIKELADEIRKARQLAQGGILGINIMFAARDFLGIVHTSIKEKIDLIITGAGVSRDIYKIGRDSQTPILPIVSSARLAKAVEKMGAAAVVVEGKEAGGHLGTDRSVKEIVPEVREAINIPVIGAGGIIDGREIVKMLKLGADGVQLATRFVFAEECNASKEFKEAYAKIEKYEDLALIPSSTGFPGQAIKTKLVEKLLRHEAPKPTHCDFCLKSCTYEYCIYDALMNALKGDIENGIVFAGENLHKIKDKRILPAAKILKILVEEAAATDEKEIAEEAKKELAELQAKPKIKDRSTRVKHYARPNTN